MSEKFSFPSLPPAGSDPSFPPLWGGKEEFDIYIKCGGGREGGISEKFSPAGSAPKGGRRNSPSLPPQRSWGREGRF